MYLYILWIRFSQLLSWYFPVVVDNLVNVDDDRSRGHSFSSFLVTDDVQWLEPKGQRLKSYDPVAGAYTAVYCTHLGPRSYSHPPRTVALSLRAQRIFELSSYLHYHIFKFNKLYIYAAASYSSTTNTNYLLCTMRSICTRMRSTARGGAKVQFHSSLQEKIWTSGLESYIPVLLSKERPLHRW